MKIEAAEALAKWLAENQPEIFEGALRAAQGKPIPRTASNLAGIADVMSSIGTGLSTAVRSVGSFIASPGGVATLGTLGGLYLQSQAQRDALRLQTSAAQAGYSPYPVQNTGYNTNSAIPIYTPTGQMLTPQLTNQLYQQSVTASIMQYLPWGIGILAALFFFSSRR